MMTKSGNCCVLLSGGLDSTIAAYWAIKEGFSVEAIYFSLFENEQARGRDCAMNIADKIGIRLHVLNVPLTQQDYISLLPLHSLSREETMNGNETSIFASLVMWLTIGTTFCIKQKLERLLLGLNLANTHRHQGIRNEFFRKFEQMLNVGLSNHVDILHPFLELTKEEVIQIGLDLDVPFELTWSCRNNSDTPCGKCFECKERTRAFQLIGVPDPLWE